MGFRLRRKEEVVEGVRRIAAEEIDRALAEIADGELPPQTVVHEARKHCKKLRGLLRLVQPAMGDAFHVENDGFAASARMLAFARDADVAPLTLERLIAHYAAEVNREACHSLCESLKRHRPRTSEDDDSREARLTTFAERMRAARARIPAWPLSGAGFELFADGLKKTYRRARRKMQAAYDEPISENFHLWRKHAKYHGYHMRLLAGLWKQEMQVRRSAAEYLADLLGDHHDLVVLRGVLSDADTEDATPDLKRTLISLINRRSRELETTAYPLGMRLFAEKPEQLVRRFRRYWRVWKKKR